MKYKNWDYFKIHCSGISKIMSRPKGCNPLTNKDLEKLAKTIQKEEKDAKDLEVIEFYRLKNERFNHPPLSEAAKEYLIDRYSCEKYNLRRASTSTQQKATITKGVALETEGIELVSFIDKIKYERPEKAVSNDYMIGLCDGFCVTSNKIVDIKTSWNAANFMSNRRDNKLSFYHWAQIQGYLELYNIDNGQVCFVLVNTPPHLIDQQKTVLFKKYTFGEITGEKYEEELEKYDSIFDYSKIPITKRVIRFNVPRCKEFMPLVYNKVDMCRVWLNEFERVFLSNKNILTLPEQYINVNSEEDNTEHNA